MSAIIDLTKNFSAIDLDSGYCVNDIEKALDLISTVQNIYICFKKSEVQPVTKSLDANGVWLLHSNILFPESIAEKLKVKTSCTALSKNDILIHSKLIDKVYNPTTQKLPKNLALIYDIDRDDPDLGVVQTSPKSIDSIKDLIEWRLQGYPPAYTQKDINEYVKNNHPDILCKGDFEVINQYLNSSDQTTKDLGWNLFGSFNLFETPNIFRYIMNFHARHAQHFTQEIEFYYSGIHGYEDTYSVLMKMLFSEKEFNLVKDEITRALTLKMGLVQGGPFGNIQNVTLDFYNDKGIHRQLRIDSLSG